VPKGLNSLPSRGLVGHDVSVITRPASPEDLPAAAELARRADTAWFGAPERDQDEIGEYFEQVADFETSSRMFFDDDRLVAVALRNDTDAWFETDPDQEVTRRVADALIDWFAGFEKPKMEALDRNSAMRNALEARGWRHLRSSFELMREVTDDWTLAAPSYPSGVEVREFSVDEAEAMYRLIYVDAGWADVPGHPHREFEGWRSLFINESTAPEQQVLAWRGDRLVGVSIGRIFSDGMGWIAQLAVARDERGNGLGRALLLDGLRRRREGGATMLGLQVQADNRNALNLYLDTGLQIDREWMEYRPA
jgi:ribosomal protein S18 acetylase RimI-like enzyme